MITISLSNSALSHSGCMLDFKRTVIDGYKEKASSANIVYGEAVHKFIDVMFKTNEYIPTATLEAVKVFNQPKVSKDKSPHLDDQRHMLSTALNVWELYVKEDHDFELLMLDLPCWACKNVPQVISNATLSAETICPWCKGTGHYSRPATELTFSLPYYQDDDITVNLEGTIDSIGKIVNGCHVIRDWKTTSTWDMKNYFVSYRMSRQLRFYSLALRLMAECEPDSVLGKIGSGVFGSVIDAIFIKPQSNDCRCARSEVFRYSDKEINEFRESLDDFIEEVSYAVHYDFFKQQGILSGSCEKKYGLCSFFNVCSVSENVAQVLLKRDFKVQKYNPLNYSGL